MPRIVTRTMPLLFLALVASVMTGCAQAPESAHVPIGTAVVVALQTPLSTEQANSGTAIVATTQEDIMIDNETIVPVDARVHGIVTGITAPENESDTAKMTVQFTDIEGEDGATYEFETAPITLIAKVEAVGPAPGDAEGGVINDIAKNGSGQGSQALIDARDGGTWAVTTTNNHIMLESGQQFRIETIAPTRLPIMDDNSPANADAGGY